MDRTRSAGGEARKTNRLASATADDAVLLARSGPDRRQPASNMQPSAAARARGGNLRALCAPDSVNALQSCCACARPHSRGGRSPGTEARPAATDWLSPLRGRRRQPDRRALLPGASPSRRAHAHPYPGPVPGIVHSEVQVRPQLAKLMAADMVARNAEPISRRRRRRRFRCAAAGGAARLQPGGAAVDRGRAPLGYPHANA